MSRWRGSRISSAVNSSAWGNAGQRIGLCAVLLGATVPFLGKAFHIDDPLYLSVARQILREPWDPFGAEVLWEHDQESLFDADFNPPLWSYVIAAVLVATGEPAEPTDVAAPARNNTHTQRAASRTPEVALHLVESVFVGAAILALYRLAGEWVRWPLLATILVVFSPAFLPGQNVMLEGPVMAFWLWAVWCYRRAIATGDQVWTWACGILAAVGVLTKYTFVVLLVILTVDCLVRRQWRVLWLLAPPVAALVLWSFHNLLVYERMHAWVMMSRVQTGGREPTGIQLVECGQRIWAMIRLVGAVTALAIPLACTLVRIGRIRSLLMLSITSGAAAWWPQREEIALFRRVELSGGSSTALHAWAYDALGLFVVLSLALTVLDSARLRTGERGDRTPANDQVFLWLWLAAVAVFFVSAAPFVAARHFLPGLPPLVLLVLRRLQATPPLDRGMLDKIAVGVAAFVTSACGFAVAKADYDFANWYRHLAFDRGARVVAAARADGRQVWFTGHWGWAYYAERAGLLPYLGGRSDLREGDIMVVPFLQTWSPMDREHARRLQSAMDTMKPLPPPPLSRWPRVSSVIDVLVNSVRSIATDASLYAANTLAWQFSRAPLDEVAVVRVTGSPHEP